jgi:hypothetical protein
MSVWSNHSSALLPFLFLPVAFGCQEPARLSDGELSHRLTSNTTRESASILLVNGAPYDGFLVGLRGDTLEWYESPDAKLESRHTTLTDDVRSIWTRSKNTYRPLWFGLAGFGIGGFAACSGEFVYSTANAYGPNGNTTPQFNSAVPLIGAIGGAVAGVIIGKATDHGSLENTWQFKTRTATQDTSSKQ